MNPKVLRLKGKLTPSLSSANTEMFQLSRPRLTPHRNGFHAGHEHF